MTRSPHGGPAHHRVGALRGRDAVAIGASLACVAATFLPWARSGRRVRNSYDLVDVADRAGLLPDRLAGLAPLWLLVPVLGGIAVFAVGLGRTRLGGFLTTTLGALVVLGGVLLHRSPLVPLGGASAAVAAGAIALVAGLVQVTTAPEEPRR